MIPSARLVMAFVANVAVPALVYKIALAHSGLTVALSASAVPVLVWMLVDFARFRHVDALSALVLTSVVLSLLVLLSGAGQWLHEAREPAVSGIVGLLFLLSLMLDRPLVYYLARSTLARERQGREIEFDEMWRTRATLARSIRLMTVVWGLGLVGENIARLWITCCVTDSNPQRLSTILRYATYGALTAWTLAYRRLFLKRE